MLIVPIDTNVRPVRGGSLDKRRRARGSEPSAEALETRQLLSFLNPFGSKFARIRSGGVLDVISVGGPGQVLARRVGQHSIAIVLAGTTQDSQVSISSLGARAHEADNPLQIASIRVKTGRLGSFNAATTGDLDGPLSPLIGPVNSLQLDSLGQGARINVDGNLGTLTVNRGVNLGQTGIVNVTNDLTGPLTVSRDVVLQGGQIKIGRDLSGSLTIGGNLMVGSNGLFSVGRNLAGTSTGTAATGGGTIGGNLDLDSGGKLTVGGNASTLTVGGNVEASTGGGLQVTANLGSLTVNGGGGTPATGNLTLNPGGLFSVGGNLTTLSVGSDLQVLQGTTLNVAGNLTSLTVGGNVQTSQTLPQTANGVAQPTPGGEISVGADLGTLAVTGVVQGKGSEDIVVGDDLGQLTVLGGGEGAQGLQGVDVDVAKNLQGVDIRNGIDDSSIRAGILINGGTAGAGSNGWNIGPDGFVAVLDSQIRAGFEITNFTIGGDVESDLPGNPTSGRATRIVAGEDRNGNFLAGGVIDNFQIIGNLVDSVLAASVPPSGGSYPQPDGSVEVGFVGNPAASISSSTTVPTSAKVTVQPGPSDVALVVATPAGAPANPTQLAQLQNSPLLTYTDDTDPDDKGGGAINPSFAAPLQLVPPEAASGTKLPLPSKPTVTGSVITTSPHVAGTDYSGFFAANTNGIIVGLLPTSAPLVPK